MFILRIQTKGGFSALLKTAAVLSFAFPVGGEYGSAAIENAGALAPAAYSDFVISCNQAFRIIFIPYFRLAPLQLNQSGFFGAVGTSLTHTEHPEIIAASVGNTAVVSRFDTAGSFCKFRIAFAEVNKVHSRPATETAALTHQRTTDTRRVVNPLTLCAAD